MKSSTPREMTLCFSVLLLLLGGCQPSESTRVDPAVIAEHRSRLVLEAEPAGAVGIQELRTQLLDQDGSEAEEVADVTVSTDPVEVVLLGRIGGSAAEGSSLGAEFPWDKGRAAFVMVDPSFSADAESHDHDASADEDEGADHEGVNHEEADHDDAQEHAGHDHDASHAAGDDQHDCPFCNQAKQATAAQAIVQFIGEDGDPLPIDARQLFDLQGDELVVIKGQARLSVGMLIVKGEQIYVRR